jgi:MFS family permease
MGCYASLDDVTFVNFYQRFPFFYGWIIVIAAMVGAAFMVGTSVFSIGVYAAEMQAELGWTRSELFGALALRLTAGALLSPFLGVISDRRGGARVIMTAAAVLMGLSLAPLRWTDSLLVFYLVYGGLGAIASAVLGSIMLGVVPKWFIRKRAKAVAVAAAGGALGPLIFPVLNAELISAVGWRDAWFAVGVLALALLVPLSFGVHRSPEDVGLLPDGETAETELGPRRQFGAEYSYTLREALHTRSFWLLTMAFSFALMSMNSWQPSWVPYLTNAGFSLRVASSSILVFGVFSFSGRFIWGPAAQRFPPHRLIIAQLSTTTTALLLLLSISNIPLLYVWSMIYGVSTGGFWLLQPLTLANYFGAKHLGAIRGLNQPFLAIASGIAPISAAALFDATDSYVGVMAFAASTAAIGGTLGFMSRAPKLPKMDTPEGKDTSMMR